ncbi:hypothetical protein CsSME_00043553 [Camellia sinensis var. sinensis]
MWNHARAFRSNPIYRACQNDLTLEESEIAWRDAKYGQIFEYLRDEYEVTQRFGNLDFKLKFVEAQRLFSSSPPFYRLVGDPLFLVRIGYLEEQRGSCA